MEDIFCLLQPDKVLRTRIDVDEEIDLPDGILSWRAIRQEEIFLKGQKCRR